MLVTFPKNEPKPSSIPRLLTKLSNCKCFSTYHTKIHITCSIKFNKAHHFQLRNEHLKHKYIRSTNSEFALPIRKTERTPLILEEKMQNSSPQILTQPIKFAFPLNSTIKLQNTMFSTSVLSLRRNSQNCKTLAPTLPTSSFFFLGYKWWPLPRHSNQRRILNLARKH